jgi:hypothetical protein
MDSDKRSKIEVLLRMLLAAQTEVHLILASMASETGGASREAVTRLENAHDGLQEVIDDLEGAAGTSHRHVKHCVTRHEIATVTPNGAIIAPMPPEPKQRHRLLLADQPVIPTPSLRAFGFQGRRH